MKAQVIGYNKFAKLLHWLSVVMVIGLFAAGTWMVDLSYYSEWYKTVPHWHKSAGICLLAITVIRLVWKILSKSPAIEGSSFERKVAISAHHLIYLLLFTVFVSGYMISTADGRPIEVFNWFSVPGLGSFIEDQEDVAGTIHEYATYCLIALTSLHALAALKHHFIDKNNTLKKML